MRLKEDDMNNGQTKPAYNQMCIRDSPHHAESIRPDFGLQSSAPCRLSGGEQRAGALHLQDGL